METANVIALGAFLLAGISVFIAQRSYRLSAENEKRFLADERLVFGPLMHPFLRDPPLARAVLVAQVVNLGRRKAIIENVTATDHRGLDLNVKWSDTIDDLGNPISARRLILVDPVCALHARRQDGLPFVNGTTLRIAHSQSKDAAILRFNDADGWGVWPALPRQDSTSG